MEAETAVDAHGDAAAAVDVDVNPVMHLIAPVAAVAVTLVVRKIVTSAYQRTTGLPAPLPRDPRMPLWRAIAWTALISSAAAVAEVVAYRAITHIGAKPR